VEYNGRQITISNELVYYALHKPVGHISSTSNSQGKSVMQLLPKKHRLFLVGRLDNDSSGLIIATNDGDFALKASHPRYGCEKEYFVTLDRDLSPEHILKMQKGMTLKGDKLAPVKVINAKNKSARIVLKQGVNRQIRRMLGSLGYTVVKLKRVRIGKLEIGDLEVGKNMKITPDQVI
jgi:pseudouridine synthase